MIFNDPPVDPHVAASFSRLRISRQVGHCAWCGEVIPRGWRHVLYAVKWEFDTHPVWSDFRLHLQCDEAWKTSGLEELVKELGVVHVPPIGPLGHGRAS